MPNYSAFGAPVSVVLQTPAAGVIKFWPGHYAWNLGTFSRTNATEQLGLALAFIDSLASNPNFVGVQIDAFWGALESDTAGVYSAPAQGGQPIGFYWVDQILTRCAQYGKKLMLNCNNSMYGYSNLNDGYPNYLWHDTSLGPVGQQYTVGARTDFREAGVIAAYPPWIGDEAATAILWEAPVMNRLIALQAAYGARYNGNSNFIMWGPQTNMSHDGSLTGLNNAGLVTQTNRLIAAGVSAFPNTEKRLWMDYFGDDAGTQAKQVMDVAIAADWGGGGNDVLPVEEPTADAIFNGHLFGNDARGKNAWCSMVSGPELCGKDGTNLPSVLFNHAMDGSHGIAAMRPQYFSWTQQLSCPSDLYNWPGIVTFVNSINGAISNGRDSTRRTPLDVRTNYYPTNYP